MIKIFKFNILIPRNNTIIYLDEINNNLIIIIFIIFHFNRFFNINKTIKCNNIFRNSYNFLIQTIILIISIEIIKYFFAIKINKIFINKFMIIFTNFYYSYITLLFIFFCSKYFISKIITIIILFIIIIKKE